MKIINEMGGSMKHGIKIYLIILILLNACYSINTIQVERMDCKLQNATEIHLSDKTIIKIDKDTFVEQDSNFIFLKNKTTKRINKSHIDKIKYEEFSYIKTIALTAGIGATSFLALGFILTWAF